MEQVIYSKAGLIGKNEKQFQFRIQFVVLIDSRTIKILSIKAEFNSWKLNEKSKANDQIKEKN